MANQISIFLQSDLRPSQISSVDVLLIDRADVNNTKFMILTDFPDRLDLVEGVKLNCFWPIRKQS